MWRCGDAEMGSSVDVEMCRCGCGDVEIWKCGDVDVANWRCGDV